ncbi:sugar O-acetyltransferase [Salinimonas lutimaris]|uniref:sugar O-acetyltransferase n=1 Tax=Salinimonas lutimaris TaxID=914153 RepID=UPI0010C0FB4A|nr:sugar O-acetyltransferase [Salinimonas lutimaris]
MSLDEIKQKMHSGEVYFSHEPALVDEQTQCLEILYDYNQSRPSQHARRQQILTQLFARMGENCYFEPPLRANWGKHTYVGKQVYANFNLTLVDDTTITIGDYVMFAPNVTLATAGHPIEPGLRRHVGQFNMPVTIENNVWIGAHTVVLPGVTIGENSVIGAGSVVTRDIPANVVAVGNPCRVLRPIGENDKQRYFKDRQFDPALQFLMDP